MPTMPMVRFVALLAACSLVAASCTRSRLSRERASLQSAGLPEALADAHAATPPTLPRPTLRPLPPARQRAKDRLTVVAVGDIMLGSHFPDSSTLHPGGATAVLADLASVLRDADLTVGNLEGVLLDTGAVVKRCQDPDACYAFRSPEVYAEVLADVGFDFLSLANNHSGDFGPHGRDSTKHRLAEVGIAYAGLAGSDEVAYRSVGGRRLAFLGFAPNSGTVDVRDLDRARELVARAAAEAEIVIVSFHGGAEGADAQRVPRATETYYGEDRGDVYAFAHACVDAGADLVFGHGPHVTRAVELYRGRLIAYSLGNFATYGRFSLRGPKGVAPVLRVDVDGEGAFLRGEAIPTIQTKPTGPMLDPERRAVNLLRELSTADFPESPLLVDPDGQLVVRPG